MATIHTWAAQFGVFDTKSKFEQMRTNLNKSINTKSAENDTNSTYCPKCQCRITRGRCAHGVNQYDKADEIRAAKSLKK